MALPVTTTTDDFEHWLAAMDDHLKEFFAAMPEQVRDRLDYSPASLDLVERWILDKYPNTEAMLAEGESKSVNQLACYIGETFRKTLGGRWSIRLDDPKFAFHGLPILFLLINLQDSMQ
jgi:hypothetical protein